MSAATATEQTSTALATQQSGGLESTAMNPVIVNQRQQLLEIRQQEIAVLSAEWKHREAQAKLFAEAGLFGQKYDANDPAAMRQSVARCLVKMELGRSMGFSDAESLSGVEIIADRTAIAAHLRGARMQAAGYDWDIEWHWEGAPEVTECTGCTLFLFKISGGMRKPLLTRDNKQVAVSYLKADALRQKTQIWEWNERERKKLPRTCSILEKDNWQNSPRNMYYARAITNAQRWYAPGVLNATLLSIEEAIDLPVGEIERPGFDRAQIRSAEQVAEEKLSQFVDMKKERSGETVKEEARPEPEVKAAAAMPDPKQQAPETKVPADSTPALKAQAEKKEQEPEGHIPNDAQEPPPDSLFRGEQLSDEPRPAARRTTFGRERK